MYPPSEMCTQSRHTCRTAAYVVAWCIHTSLMAIHLAALSSLMMLSATLTKCWLSSWTPSWLWLVASVDGCMGTSAARESSWMRDTMSSGCSPSCWVCSKAWAETSSRADAWARLVSADGCCSSTGWEGQRRYGQLKLFFFFCCESFITLELKTWDNST